jgi:hypothetical protein
MKRKYYMVVDLTDFSNVSLENFLNKNAEEGWDLAFLIGDKAMILISESDENEDEHS